MHKYFKNEHSQTPKIRRPRLPLKALTVNSWRRPRRSLARRGKKCDIDLNKRAGSSPITKSFFGFLKHWGDKESRHHSLKKY